MKNGTSQQRHFDHCSNLLSQIIVAWQTLFKANSQQFVIPFVGCSISLPLPLLPSNMSPRLTNAFTYLADALCFAVELERLAVWICCVGYDAVICNQKRAQLIPQSKCYGRTIRVLISDFTRSEAQSGHFSKRNDSIVCKSLEMNWLRAINFKRSELEGHLSVSSTLCLSVCPSEKCLLYPVIFR